MLKNVSICVCVCAVIIGSQVFAHCGTCGIGPSGEKAVDWGKKRLDGKVGLLRAFDMTKSDRKKMILLEETFHTDMKAVKDRYKVQASALLNEAQQAVYFNKKRGRKACCNAKGKNI